MKRTTKSQFFPTLESLRGVASVWVMIGHAYVMSVPPAQLTVNQPDFNFLSSLVSALLDPQPAVLLFFVLSGFVLGLQLDCDPINSIRSYIAYIVRRLFRLMPLMWFSFVFAFLLFLISTSFDYPSKLQINEQLGFFLNSFLLQDFQTNIVTWTLYVEIIGSAVLPIFFLIATRSNFIVNAFIIIVLLSLSIFVQYPLPLQFFVFFYAGLLIGYIPQQISLFFKGNIGLLLWILSISIYFGAKYLIPGQMNWLYGCWQRWQWAEVGTCALIVYFVSTNRFPRVQNMLLKPSMRFLGRISFSLYLLHYPIIVFFIKVMSHIGIGVTVASTAFEMALFFIILTFVTSIIAIPLSTFTYWKIERPVSDVGRTLSFQLRKIGKSNPQYNAK